MAGLLDIIGRVLDVSAFLPCPKEERMKEKVRRS
jgi:hypothetical protein